MDTAQAKQIIQSLEDTTTAITNRYNATDAKAKETLGRVGALEQEFARLPAGGFTASAPTKTNPVAAAIVEGDQLTTVRAGAPSTGLMNVQQPLRAAISNPGSGQTGDTTYPTPTYRETNVQGIPAVRLSILDLLPTVSISEKVYEFVVLDGYQNAADYQVKEGDLKAGTDLPTKLARSEVATIAHWLPASLQVLDDNAGLQTLIQQVLSVGCRQKLEREVLIGNGGDGKIKGLVPQATVYDPMATTTADRVGAAITDLNAAGWNANAIVMHPETWFAISSAKNTTSDYLLGSPRDPSPASLWGVRVVTSPAMVANMVLVLDTSVTALLDRQQVSVQVSRHDGDNFRRNMVTILAELRAGLAVYATSGTRLVSLTKPSS